MRWSGLWKSGYEQKQGDEEEEEEEKNNTPASGS